VRYVVVHTSSPWPPVVITDEWVESVIDGVPEGATVDRVGSAFLIDLGEADVPTDDPGDLAR
jgi:hypothetical protein